MEIERNAPVPMLSCPRRGWYTGALWSILSIAIASAAVPGLEGTGSGFYGLSPGPGPFGRQNLSTQTTETNPVFTIQVNDNGQRDEVTGFTYVATLASEASVTYGAFTGRISFELQAKPKSVVLNGSELINTGHSEVVAHLNLVFTDTGIVTSNSQPAGTPVVMTFTVTHRAISVINEPTVYPSPNNESLGLDSGGYLTVFDENSLQSLNGAPFPQNGIQSYSFNTAIGHRLDLTASTTFNGSGYAGYVGYDSNGSLIFYSNIVGTLDSSVQISISGPPGVTFAADSGHDYTPADAASSSLANISTRGFVGTGDNVMIGGFIITGTTPKKVLLRAIGPSLGAFGVTGPLADPVLELHGSDGGLMTRNDNWKDDQESEIEATGIPPSDALESAILATLDPGSYTAIVTGKNGASGVGLVESYDLDPAADSQLGNISTRGFVDTGNNVMIGGFILGEGGTDATVLIRAVGPSLTQFGVTGALADPILELHDQNGTLLASDDNWRDFQQTAIESIGLQPESDLESALLETLSAGAYTAVVSGKGGLTGVALVEIYRLP